MHSRWKNGKVAESDLHIAEGMLGTSESEAKLARLRYGNAIRALETLLGRYPCATLPIRDDFPKFPQTLAAGLPAEMLERRPDLARSEREVAAALKWTSSARAAQLPRISLTAEGGTASSALRDLADPKHLIWNMAVNMLTPVLDGGRLAADVDRADARAREAVARYGREALNALREVESFLDAEQALGEREKRLGATFEHMSASHTAALSRMEKGAGDPIFTLDTERIALAAKKDWSLAIMEKWQNRVDLCLALGGDFERKAEKKQP
jgi:outer membrane protein TolC